MYTKRVAIIPYNIGSASAKLLAANLRKALKIPVIRVRKDSLRYQPRWTDYVINWGCSADWDWINSTDKKPWIDCTNKLTFFEKVTHEHNKVFPKMFINIPEWTTDPKVVKEWVTADKIVLARTKLNGHSGQGIVFVDPPYDTITYAPLYVQYKKKRHEYRVHVFGSQNDGWSVIDVTQKKKRKGFENVDTKIRNHKNGWVYAREGIVEPQDLRTQALNAAWCANLPFAAIDLIWNEKENKCYVLEVNTAPGIDGTTLEKYTQAFLKDIQK